MEEPALLEYLLNSMNYPFNFVLENSNVVESKFDSLIGFRFFLRLDHKQLSITLYSTDIQYLIRPIYFLKNCFIPSYSSKIFLQFSSKLF